jgi:hypothetical protein
MWFRVLLYIGVFTCSLLSAKNIVIVGSFNKDSIALGEKVEFGLKVKFDLEDQMLLPDSSSDFGNFKLIGVKTFPSRSTVGRQIDSVSYQLVSFSMDTVLYLKLPVKLFSEGDSSIIYSNDDSVSMVLGPLNTRLTQEVDYLPIYFKFNYQLWVLFLMLLALFVWVFKKFYWARIIRLWQRLTLRSRFKLYIRNHNLLLRQFQGQKTMEVLERLLSNWKQMMEELSGKPITTYTAKEINALYNDPRLLVALQNIDVTLYSGVFSDQLVVDLEIVYNKSKLEFQKLTKAKTREKK